MPIKYATSPVVVTLKKTAHKKDPYTFSIDDFGPGPHLTVKERYFNRSSAKRGAIRKLDAYKSYHNDIFLCYKTQDHRPIMFLYIDNSGLRKKRR